MFAHALWRSLLLMALGVFLRSMRGPQTYFTFEDTLSQIGLRLSVSVPARLPPAEVAMDCAGGGPGVATGWHGRCIRWPGPGFDYQAVGVPPIGSITTPASRRIGTRMQFRQCVRPMVPESVPARRSLSSLTAAAISR